jgi:hypothetical protein
MTKGTTVYQAYMCVSPGEFWINDGTVTGIVSDGVPLVLHGGVMVPLDATWHRTKTEAKRDAQAQLVRQIGRLQAKADALHDEILHEVLTTEEVAA